MPVNNHVACAAMRAAAAAAGRSAVNCLATSANGALLLSGSDDETVKVR
jgi:hypothetical protein